jgi:hypothetical protein
MLNVPPSSRAGSLPQGFELTISSAVTQDQLWVAGLLAKAVVQPK